MLDMHYLGCYSERVIDFKGIEMAKNQDIEDLVKLITKRIEFSNAKKYNTDIDEVGHFLIEVLRHFSNADTSGNRKKELAKYFNLRSMNGVFYDKKLTHSHIVKTLMIIWNCKNSRELIQKIIIESIKTERSDELSKSDLEWKKLSETLDEDEKMYLIYCGKKYKQLNKGRKKISSGLPI